VAEMMIAWLALEIVVAWSPSGLDGRSLIPGLGLAPADGSVSSTSK
jgi:beta-lactamase class A